MRHMWCWQCGRHWESAEPHPPQSQRQAKAGDTTKNKPIGPQISQLQQALDLMKGYGSKAESAAAEEEASAAQDAVEVIMERMRQDRDSEKSESQLMQAHNSRLLRAQKQLESQTTYVQKQEAALSDLDVQRALVVADLKEAKSTQGDLEQKRPSSCRCPRPASPWIRRCRRCQASSRRSLRLCLEVKAQPWRP